MTALLSADPLRATVSMIRPTASPVMPVNSASSSAPTTTIGILFERSEYWAIGTWSASATTPASATMESVVVMLMSKLSRMFGRRTPKAVRSSSSTALSAKSISSGNAASPPQIVRSHTIGWAMP